MRSKYNAPQKKKDKPVVDGYIFDSELESRFYAERIKPFLDVMIFDFKVHPKYELIPKTAKHSAIAYVADFELILANDRVTVIDVKGMATEAALIKRKVFEWRYPDLELLWICYSKIDGGWINYDLLQKARAKRRKAKSRVQQIKEEIGLWPEWKQAINKKLIERTT